MARYLGSDSSYGFFEKQVLSLNGTSSEYGLLYKIGSATAILVIRNDLIQEAGVDYGLAGGGQSILFSDVPPISDHIYVIFLGRELSVPRTAGAEPFRAESTGDGVADTFALPHGPLFEEGLQVFADGVLQRFGQDWTLATSSSVEFVTPPANGVKLDFYIHGIERTDLLTVDDHTISGEKLQIGINIGTAIDPAGDIYAQNLVLEGNLTVNGTTTTINSATLSIADNQIILNSDFSSGTPTENAAIRILRGDDPDAELLWDESTDQFFAGIVGSLERVVLGDELDAHTGNLANPHATTKAQVGLANVTNDAQLKRSANDFNTFTAITSVDDSDVLILEDNSDSGNKKSVLATNILPPTIAGDHTFTGNIIISGTLSTPGEPAYSIDDFATTNATPTTALTIPLVDDAAIFFSVRIVARNTNNLVNKTYWASGEGAARRNNAGAAALVGTPTIEEDEEGSSGYTANISVSGNNLIVQVTGAVGETVHWSVHVNTFKAA